jgi:metal-responsive CopG/Arc/MetJ family transcriptional regulator
MPVEADVMADELKDLRIPVMMAATEVAAIDEWRRKQEDLPSRSEAIRRLVELGLKAKTKG